MATQSTPADAGGRSRPFALPERYRGAARALALPIGSLVIAFILGAIVVTVTGGNAFQAYGDLLCGGLGILCGSNALPAYQVSETIVYTTPLIFTGLSVAIAFRAGLFNIGAEGQLILGVIASVAFGLHFASWPSWALLPGVLIAGMLAGAAWAGIAGVLRATTGANEVVTTIMLNYIAILLSQYLVVGGPLQAPHASSTSLTIGRGGYLPTIVPPHAHFLGLLGSVYRAHFGIVIALAAAVGFWYLLSRTTLGYELRAVGLSPRSARYAGISARRTIILAMLLSGAFAGLAGAVQVAGLRHNLTDIYSADTTGFDAIGVALLGQNAALGVVLAAILFGALHVGGQYMQSDASISANLVLVLQGFILFSIAANFLRQVKFTNLRLPTWGRRRPPTDPAIADTLVGETPAPASPSRLESST